MPLTYKTLNTLLMVMILCAPFTLGLAYGVENRPVYYYYPETTDDWPSIYYVFFGVFVAALVLFIMSVMTKPDELP